MPLALPVLSVHRHWQSQWHPTILIWVLLALPVLSVHRHWQSQWHTANHSRDSSSAPELSVHRHWQSQWHTAGLDLGATGSASAFRPSALAEPVAHGGS